MKFQKCPNCKVTLKRSTDPTSQKIYDWCPCCEYRSAANHLKIDQMFAFVSVDENGNEGIPALRIGDMAYPMVGADMSRMDFFKEDARKIMKNTGMKIKLIKFTNRIELDFK